MVVCLVLGIGKLVFLLLPNRILIVISIIKLVCTFRPKSLIMVLIILEGAVKLSRGKKVVLLLALQYIAYSGGPLDYKVGDYLSKQGIKLLSYFGLTKTGPLSLFIVLPSSCSQRYQPLRSNVNIKVEAVDSRARRPFGKKQLYKFSVTLFSWDRLFALQDWFIKNKSSAVYKVVVRQDNLVILLSGYKVQLMILKSVICKFDLVSIIVVFREGRLEIGILIKPARLLEDILVFKRVLQPVI